MRKPPKTGASRPFGPKGKSVLAALIIAVSFAGISGSVSRSLPGVVSVWKPDDDPVMTAALLQQRQETVRRSLADSTLAALWDGVPKRRGYGWVEERFTTPEEGEEAPPPLTQEQLDLIGEYMDEYYDSLTDLTLRDPSRLFADPDGIQAAGNKAVWEYMIELRKLQRSDLSLLAFKYRLRVRLGEWSTDEEEEPLPEDGKIRVTAVEISGQAFTQFPQPASYSTAIYHRFVLVETEEGWKIESHMQMDPLYVVLFLEGDAHNLRDYFRSTFPEEKGKEYIALRLETLLEEAREGVKLRSAQMAQQSESSRPASPIHPYNRQAAVDYARQWVGDRNGDWPDYGIYGGNCQNYASQCLLAGGIPMDPYGDSLWKWYSDVPHNSPGEVGRSASWSAVESFREYAENNTGFGLVAWADAPFYSGEPGDILQIGTADEPLRHSVVITEVIKDAAGNTIDYLVCSNTSDLKDFPASAYFYTTQSLVKILGWND